MSHLELKNLHISTKDSKEIIHGISLTLPNGQRHAIMGPNGGGKSTLAQALMGHPAYTITNGRIILDGIDITDLPPNERAKAGLFLCFQYPVEVPGANFAKVLRLAANEQKAEGEKSISPLKFRAQLRETAEKLGFSSELAERALNQDFSGGEKKKAEIVQMSLLKPAYAILDEPDSGLDVDALRHIAKQLNNLNYPHGLLIITHYQRILHYVTPDVVHVLVDGKIVESGDASLAEKIENTGYSAYE